MRTAIIFYNLPLTVIFGVYNCIVRTRIVYPPLTIGDVNDIICKFLLFKKKVTWDFYLNAINTMLLDFGKFGIIDSMGDNNLYVDSLAIISYSYTIRLKC